jgi:hypothetical protein
MDTLGLILSAVAGIGSLVCFILVLVQMFNRGQTTLGIVCIVLLFCCGIGGLVAFVYGWMKHREWGITNVMIAWSCFWVLGIIGGVMHPVNFQQFQPQVPPR